MSLKFENLVREYRRSEMGGGCLEVPLLDNLRLVQVVAVLVLLREYIL